MPTYVFTRKQKPLSRRLIRLFNFCGLVVVIYYLVPFLNFHRFEDVEYGHRLAIKLNDSKNNFYSPEQVCRFPVLDPFDPSIQKFIKHPKPLNCSIHQPEFTVADGNEVVFDLELGLKHNLTSLQYRYFRKANGSDSSVFYSEWKNFPPTYRIPLQHWSGVSIRGSYGLNSNYVNIHSSIEPLIGLSKKTPEKAPEYRPSIVIIGIDSVSRSNFIRNLPLTYKYLSEEIGGWDMRGYVKIDDNTFPNMAAVLTGHKATVQMSEFKENPAREFVDDWPFIWKNLSSVGYTTMLAEEQPGIFSYKAPGFRKQPTDVYLRSYGRLLTDEPSYEPYCFGDKPESLLILESIERFMESQIQVDNPFFVFSFLWKLSHDLTYQIERLDEILYRWLEKIHRKNLLRNTLLFITSDHGNRFDDIRSTLIGRYEERMPFLFIRPPEEMLQKFPHVEEKLTQNLFRMTCHYDFYETLIDVVRGDYGDLERPRLLDRGYSLFSEIPASRSCKDIDVEEHFCVCQEEETLNINNQLAKASADAIIREINHSIQAVRDKCLPVELIQVISAERLSANKKVQNNNRYHYNKLLHNDTVDSIISFVRVTLKTKPNDAVFEGVVQITQASAVDAQVVSAVTSFDSISRINSYGQSANCVSLTHRHLEKFCTCTELV